MSRATGLLAMALALLCRPSLATLGKSDTTIESDRISMVGQRNTTIQRTNFTITEIANKTLTMREYASAEGTVFCLKWKGLHHPDLSKWLGDYHSDFVAAQKRTTKQRGSRGFSSVQGNDVIVQRYGHMGAVQGTACVSALFPAGVTSHDIQ